MQFLQMGRYKDSLRPLNIQLARIITIILNTGALKVIISPTKYSLLQFLPRTAGKIIMQLGFF